MVAALTGPGPVSWVLTAQGNGAELTGGFACAIARCAQAQLFVKWTKNGLPADDLAREAGNLARVASVPGVAHLVAFDAAAAVLVTQAVTPDPSARWDAATLGAAAATLAALALLDTTGLPRVQDWSEFEDRGARSASSAVELLAATGGDHALAAYLLNCYDQVRAWPSGPAVACHADPHPGNWVLTATGPVLVDFETLATGPAGFDAAFLAAYLNVAAPVRLAWLAVAGVDAAVAATVAGACATRMGWALRSGEGQAHPGEPAGRWPKDVEMAAVLELVAALRPTP